MPALRLGNIAPDFEAETTHGPIKFHEWIGDSWVCSNYDVMFLARLYWVLPGRPLLSPR